ncbi:MAG: YARHG domain-containing protein [Pseudomonadota bacterium]
MNKPVVFAAVFLSFVGYQAASQTASAGECQDLWYERNAIFNNNGYCFRSNLGKSLFDNSDCYTRNARLTRGEQNRVARIKRRERQLGCSVNTRRRSLY